MSSKHVVAIAERRAEVLEFDAAHLDAHGVRAHALPVARHDSVAPTQHALFGQVCDAIDATSEVLVTGTRAAVSDFSRYVRAHRPAMEPRIVGYDVLRRPTQMQLVALARQFFVRDDGRDAPCAAAERPCS